MKNLLIKVLFLFFVMQFFYACKKDPCIKDNIEITYLDYAILNCSPPYIVKYYFEYEDFNGCGIDEYLWRLHDSSLTNSQNPTDTIFTPGIYEVALKISNSTGFAVKSLTVDASQPSYPVVSAFSASGVSFPQSCYLYLTNKSKNATSYLWDFGDGYSSTQVNPSHNYSSPGHYVVTLVSQCNGQSDTSSLMVNVHPDPEKVYIDRLYLALPDITADLDSDEYNNNLLDYYFQVYFDEEFWFSTPVNNNIVSFPSNWWLDNYYFFLGGNHQITFRLMERDQGSNDDDFITEYYFTSQYLLNNCFPSGFWMGGDLYCYLSYQ